MSYQRSPVLCVSNFLNELLARLYLNVARRATYISGIDVIRQLEQYKNSGRLSKMIPFVTFDVSDLFTMLPRNGAIGNLKIDTIVRLARLVLNNNYVAYDTKNYKQIRGGAMGSPFTVVLVSIYMLEWKHPLIEHQQRDHGLDAQ